MASYRPEELIEQIEAAGTPTKDPPSGQLAVGCHYDPDWTHPVGLYQADEELVSAHHALLNLIHGPIWMACLHTAIRLRVPDVVAKAGHPLTAEEISGMLESKAGSVESLFRIMRMLVRLGVFEEVGGDGLTAEGTRFGMNKMSELLIRREEGSDRPSLAQYALMQAWPATWNAWLHFPEAIQRGGSNAFEIATGASNPYTYMEQDPQLLEIFAGAMADTAQESIAAILKEYDGFGDSGTLVDVGGSQGMIAGAIKARHPRLRVLCFDLPSVISRAAPVPEVELVAGDMFDSIPQADIIFMRHILHNHSNEACVKILINCHRALAPTGKLVIADPVIQAGGGAKPSLQKAKSALTYDILMLACLPGAKERTRHEWETLLFEAGFQIARIVHMSRTVVDIIEAVKIES